MDTKTPKIFILDDEAIFSFSLEHYFTKAGFSDIHRFETSTELYPRMEEQPDVLILDHFLQNELGTDVLENVKQSNPELKVIYLSAQKTAAIAIKSLKLGAFAYLEKSLTDIQEIIQLINSEEQNILSWKESSAKKFQRQQRLAQNWTPIGVFSLKNTPAILSQQKHQAP